MPEDKTGSKVKMVPEAELLAIKGILRSKEKKWESEKAELTGKVSQLDNQLKIAKANGDDSEEVAVVKQMLLDQAKEVEGKRAKLDEDLSSHTKREREFRARQVASDMKSKGVEVDVESLLEVEDFERHAQGLLVDHLAKENETLRKNPQGNSPESVFDLGAGGVVKKSFKDMTPVEFAAAEKEMKQ